MGVAPVLAWTENSQKGELRRRCVSMISSNVAVPHRRRGEGDHAADIGQGWPISFAKQRSGDSRASTRGRSTSCSAAYLVVNPLAWKTSRNAGTARVKV